MLPVSAKTPVRFQVLAEAVTRGERELEALRAVASGMEVIADSATELTAGGEVDRKRFQRMLEEGEAELAALKARKEAEPEEPVYLIAAADAFQRAAFPAAMTEHGCRFPAGGEVVRTLRRAVEFCVEPQQQPELADILDEAEVLPEERWPASLEVRIGDMTAQLRGHFPDLDALLAARERYTRTAPIVAAQLFLRGWEGLAIKYEARAGRVTTACLSALPAEHVSAIGRKALELMHQIPEQTVKN
ncbi:hypothetical protein [Oceanibaculum nanhaiense]|uniref:hypothetical protein n=1 Tax=Oceanibaculum nanhaiense TaxID=1909734 RepID=UPI000A3CF5FA|nr:hypothetical protein [Oceanibaculum nanhaiense]